MGRQGQPEGICPRSMIGVAPAETSLCQAKGSRRNNLAELARQRESAQIGTRFGRERLSETAGVARPTLRISRLRSRIGAQIGTRFGRERLSETAGVARPTLRISRLRSGRRWCQDEMPKWEVIFARTLRGKHGQQTPGPQPEHDPDQPRDDEFQRRQRELE